MKYEDHLPAGMALFAERGFNGVTVRDIAKRSETHLSALNYHFRTKEALYREAILEACKSDSLSPEEREQMQTLDHEMALYVLVKETIRHYAEQKTSRWKTVIIYRECWDPSPVFEEVVKEYFKPETDFTAQIIGRVVGKPADSHAVSFAAIVLIGLLTDFGSFGHFIDAVTPGLRDKFHKNDWLVRHIVRIAVGAANDHEEE